MKVTAGKYRGKNILARDERTLRPTSSRIREAIFNMLMHGRFFKDESFIHDGEDLVDGRRVVDIFCGTGALGIEALSRGASHLTLIDQNPKTLSLARENVMEVGEEANTSFIRSDSTLLPQAPQPCQLAFVDPPYNHSLGTPALKSLGENGWLSHGAVVVVELSKRDELELPEKFHLLDERIYDKTKLVIAQYR